MESGLLNPILPLGLVKKTVLGRTEPHMNLLELSPCRMILSCSRDMKFKQFLLIYWSPTIPCWNTCLCVLSKGRSLIEHKSGSLTIRSKPFLLFLTKLIYIEGQLAQKSVYFYGDYGIGWVYPLNVCRLSVLRPVSRILTTLRNLGLNYRAYLGRLFNPLLATWI